MRLLKSSKINLRADNIPQPHPVEVEGKTKLAEYSIKRHLGKGNCASVKEALHIPTKTLCALKIITKSSIPNYSYKTSRGRPLFEMTILDNIAHPNIIRVRDAFQTTDCYYIALELAAGGVLFDRIAPSGRFTEKDAAALLYSVVDALAMLHDHDIVHRDLKPDNIMFKTKAPNSQIVIMDFGVAVTVYEDELHRTNIVGTPRYSAPEILHQEPHGKPCDMWSVGCIAYTLLCGFNPFHEAKTFTAIKKLVLEPVQFQPRYWSHISDNAISFISCCLTVDPNDRLTARQALVHPWFVQLVDAARELAKSIIAVAPKDSDVINLDVTHFSDSAPVDLDTQYPMAAQLAQIATAAPQALTEGLQIVDEAAEAQIEEEGFGSRIEEAPALAKVPTVVLPRRSTTTRRLMSVRRMSVKGPPSLRVTTVRSHHSGFSDQDEMLMTPTVMLGGSPGGSIHNFFAPSSAVFRSDVEAGLETPVVADSELPNLAEEVWDVAAQDAEQQAQLADVQEEAEEEDDNLLTYAKKKKELEAAGEDSSNLLAVPGRKSGPYLYENHTHLVVMPEETVVMGDVTVAGLDLAGEEREEQSIETINNEDAKEGIHSVDGSTLAETSTDLKAVDSAAVAAERDIATPTPEDDFAGVAKKWMRFSFLRRRTLLKKKVNIPSW
ncbi:kinase-like domain-containing protein [Cladochytrium replicatum]|nr:kinase-like domain-containing protein [Cladochytrium replicatum]